MIIKKPPEEWEAPEWHEDFGDPRAEIEELRSLAIAIRNTMLCTTFTLEIPEPGFIEVSVVLPNSVPVKMLLAPSTTASRRRRFAVFLYPDSEDEIEEYLDSVDAVVSFLAKHASETTFS